MFHCQLNYIICDVVDVDVLLAIITSVRGCMRELEISSEKSFRGESSELISITRPGSLQIECVIV